MVSYREIVMSRRDGGGGLERRLPLKPQWFHILLALSRDAQHGSGIVRSVLEETGGKLHLWPATLYGSLEELAALGCIAEVTEAEERPAGSSDRQRFYRITPGGVSLLNAEVERLEGLVTMARERLEAGAASS
jgi:DNA-binding PadR family transcriptional regulator